MPAPRGVPQIEIKLDVDANGVLKVSAKDNATGKENSITITGSSGLSDEEISKMVSEAEADNIKNKDKLEKIKSKNNLDGAISQAEKFIKENENIDTSILKTEIDSSKVVIANESASKEEIVASYERLMKVFQDIGSKMYEQQTTEANTTQNEFMNEEDVVDAEFTEN